MNIDLITRVAIIAGYGTVASAAFVAYRYTRHTGRRTALTLIAATSFVFLAAWGMILSTAPVTPTELRFPVWISRVSHFPNIAAHAALVWVIVVSERADRGMT